mgnify:CR=1 FL=1
MSLVNLVTSLHKATARDYLSRGARQDKAELAERACLFEEDYWDGDRAYGYGGYYYDGRWRPVAESLVKRYGLRSGQSVLDIGCGKGFLLYELTQIVPGLRVVGLDISSYALKHCKPEIADKLVRGSAHHLPFPDQQFDLVLSLTTLHNLLFPQLWNAFEQIQWVGKGQAYITVDSYRNEREKANLLAWQLTLRALMKPEEWEWLFQKVGYIGDWEYIFYE